MTGGRPLRIAHVLRSFLAPSQTFILTQLRAQRDLDQLILARSRVGDDPVPAERLWHLSPAGTTLERAVFRLWRGPGRPDPFPRLIHTPIARFGADVVHAHFGWRGLDALPAARRLGLPLLTALHGRDVYSPLHRPGGAHGLYDELFATGNAFTFVGPTARDELVRQGCPAERTHLVPVGLDLEQFTYAPAPLERPLVFLQIARLVGKKGVDTSIRAFAAARDELGPSTLWIVGDGPDRAELERLACELGAERDVVFHGAQPSQRVRELLGQAHFALQPSRIGEDGDREGTPTVIIEAQARGVDVLATDHADIAFIVADPGSLLPEGDHAALAAEMVRRAALSAAERDERLRAGRALVERQHDARHIARTLAGIYGAIAGERPRA